MPYQLVFFIVILYGPLNFSLVQKKKNDLPLSIVIQITMHLIDSLKSYVAGHPVYTVKGEMTY